ncbi:hypothetical protein GZH47_32985 (plasmid) [Paenibacillus rhizovicinus]|uniref:Uncharacterized protein n=1 Tax=Paenibacillus rhizovicinus TaxID=2704463 RepID=A0A6C0PAV3_9BACL|nr:hypothetical protein [Paenibacillus rhizovicinus]QHW35710.1 hypothetical protein GZH47_32985 [Paenibacillus rhizovicinus]
MELIAEYLSCTQLSRFVFARFGHSYGYDLGIRLKVEHTDCELDEDGDYGYTEFHYGDLRQVTHHWIVLRERSAEGFIDHVIKRSEIIDVVSQESA